MRRWLYRLIDRRIYRELDTLIARHNETVDEISRLRADIDRLRLEIRILQTYARNHHD